MRYEWDEAKEVANLQKHGLSFTEVLWLFESGADYLELFDAEVPELTDVALDSAILASQRRRLVEGKFESGRDVSALRHFVGLSQVRFAKALGISVHTLRNWEQGRRWPEGPALALLRIAARHPRILRENLEQAA